MLVRLMYASRAAEGLKPDALSAIVRKSTAHNPAHGVTGVLCFSGTVFLQVLEGGRSQVSQLYNRIAADPRHHDVVLLTYEEIAERRSLHSLPHRRRGIVMGIVNIRGELLICASLGKLLGLLLGRQRIVVAAALRRQLCQCEPIAQRAHGAAHHRTVTASAAPPDQAATLAQHL